MQEHGGTLVFQKQFGPLLKVLRRMQQRVASTRSLRQSVRFARLLLSEQIIEETVVDMMYRNVFNKAAYIKKIQSLAG